jgi:protein-disulfide isomerase
MSDRDESATLATPVSDKRDHIQGPRNAPVTLVEYGDYECPYCGEAHPIVQQVIAQFGDQLRFVFRNFPLTQLHPHAEHAAEAAESADAEGRFWNMHDMLYERQDALEDEDLVGYAAELGLDADRVRAELAAHAHVSRIREDFMSGVRSGVNGTPTFFINGRRHDGGYDLPTLSEAITIAMSPPAGTSPGHGHHHRPHAS